MKRDIEQVNWFVCWQTAEESVAVLGAQRDTDRCINAASRVQSTPPENSTATRASDSVFVDGMLMMRRRTAASRWFAKTLASSSRSWTPSPSDGNCGFSKGTRVYGGSVQSSASEMTHVEARRSCLLLGQHCLADCERCLDVQHLPQVSQIPGGRHSAPLDCPQPL